MHTSIIITISFRFFRDFDAALVTFDVTSRKSYFGATIDRSEKRGEFKSWMREITDRLDDSRSAVIILGELA